MMPPKTVTVDKAVVGLAVAQAKINAALIGYLIGAGVIDGDSFLSLIDSLLVEALDPVAQGQIGAVREAVVQAAAALEVDQPASVVRPSLTVLTGGKE